MVLRATLRTKILDRSLSHVEGRHIRQSTNLMLYNQVLEKGEKLAVDLEHITLPRSTAYVFADLAPQYNWAHPCQLLLHDASSGALYEKIDAHLPPSELILHNERVEAFHSPVKMIETGLHAALPGLRAGLVNAIANAPGERYAVLFSGHSNYRHVNDLEFLYRTLIDVYGFAAGNIYVLNFNGTVDWFADPGKAKKAVGAFPSDGTARRLVVNGQGTQHDFEDTFTTLAGRLHSSDLLFIHTNNHGGGVGDGVTDFCMFAYDATGAWTPYYVNDFVNSLNGLPQYEVLMVMMEQCRSGGFITPVLNHSTAKWTHICTAVQASDYSNGGDPFDVYAEDWIAAITGQYANGGALTQTVDANNDGRISASEAFDYSDAVHHTGDTPREGESPAGCGDYIFLGLPAHDLFLRDNLLDHGREPLIDGGMSCSPDIILYNQELADRDATLTTPAAQNSDTLGEPVESGQDNFIYARVTNRGTQATSGSVKIYWSTASTLPTPASWHLIGSLAIPAVAPNDFIAVGPLVWHKADIPALGHYCFVGLVDSGGDPAPNPATIHNINDYYNFIRASNNATWKNFDVVNMFKNSTQKLTFHLQGWPKVKLSADLLVDLSGLPPAVQVKLKLIKRLSQGATLENMALSKTTQLYQTFSVESGKKAYLRGLPLRASDDTQAELEFTVPVSVDDGQYRLGVAQIVDGMEMGRVTLALLVGDYPFMANRNSLEVHAANCQWAKKIGRRNKLAYQTVEKALQHGFNGCAFCLPQYNTG